MSEWNIPLQIASYKGATFDIFTLDESNEKSLAEHAYPYVDGADIEDMGLHAHSIQLSAIYFGFGFDSKIKNLLSVLSQRGGGVLVHPVMGRIPDMVAVSYSVRYSAEDVNAVYIDMSFTKNTVGNPIFISANSLIALIDKAFGVLNEFIAVVNSVMTQTIGLVSTVRQQAHAFNYALNASLDIVIKGFDGAFGDGADNVYSRSDGALTRTQSVVNRALRSDVDVATSAKIKAGLGSVSVVNEQAGSISVIEQRTANGLAALPVNVERFSSPESKALIAMIVAQQCTAVLIHSALRVIESDDALTPPDIMQINSMIRSRIQSDIDRARTLKLFSVDNRYALIESLRAQAQMMNDVCESAINKKPPLVIRHVSHDSTMHQYAHELYSDYRRADELVALNPHLKHPTFIKQGDLVNAYAE